MTRKMYTMNLVVEGSKTALKRIQQAFRTNRPHSVNMTTRASARERIHVLSVKPSVKPVAKRSAKPTPDGPGSYKLVGAQDFHANQLCARATSLTKRAHVEVEKYGLVVFVTIKPGKYAQASFNILKREFGAQLIHIG